MSIIKCHQWSAYTANPHPPRSGKEILTNLQNKAANSFLIKKNMPLTTLHLGLGCRPQKQPPAILTMDDITACMKTAETLQAPS